MVDQCRQNERSQVTPEIERRCFIQAGLASAGTMLATSVLPSQIVSAAVPPQIDHTQREVTEMLEKADGPWLVPETTPETSRR